MSDPIDAIPSYQLPEGLIATRPPAERDGGRLMVLRPDAGAPPEHRAVAALAALLAPGDLLVVNDTRVMPARLRARRPTGGAVELLLLEAGPGQVTAMVRPGRKLKVGETLAVLGGGDQADQADQVGSVLLEARHPDGTWSLTCTPSAEALMATAGEIPLPPYLGRSEEPADRVRYQTVFARAPGAVAAPTAGLHLSTRVLAALEARGIERAAVTLHVGPGTFRTLRPEDVTSGRLHRERYIIPPETAAAVAACKTRGGRVIAVGTTATRALESATPEGAAAPTPGAAATDIFIQPGWRWRCVDGLMTNFHLPGTSLLMLVCAFGGRQRVLDAYREAIDRAYRFYSYGDAMLLLRAAETP